ncbi:MAG: DUF4846 domain-containing protein, partial [Bacteroidota bacterium]
MKNNFLKCTLLVFLTSAVIWGCTNETKSEELTQNDTEVHIPLEFPDGSSLMTAFNTPPGYERVSVENNSFEEYLRKLPLKPAGTPVRLYDGTLKGNQNAHVAVVDLPIGKKDIHQCADAVMRLRAEYLWKRGLYSQIHFNFTNGFRADYSKWMDGYRITVDGNDASWVKSAQSSNTYEDFWKYMEMVFSYAGTLSLSKELEPVAVKEMKIGDVFIRGGTPGHAVLVVDMAFNPQNGNKRFLLSQSYMPAQETHLLKNPNSNSLSPWYDLDFEGDLQTPEWLFKP